jgi:hypothetical protein
MNIRVPYHTSFVGCTQIVDATGRVTAARNTCEGPGVVHGVIEIDPAPVMVPATSPDEDPFWIPKLTRSEKFYWKYQNHVCKSVYRRFGRRLGLAAAASATK